MSSEKSILFLIFFQKNISITSRTLVLISCIEYLTTNLFKLQDLFQNSQNIHIMTEPRLIPETHLNNSQPTL